MALKDLVADRGKITEEMIEEILANFIRYELKPNVIVFTPEGAALSNEAKILVYLVAVLGWQYVGEDVRLPNERPTDLEAALGIAGGTLRPLLKKLKDAHLLTVVDGHYSVRLANLHTVAGLSAVKNLSPLLSGRLIRSGQNPCLKNGKARHPQKVDGVQFPSRPH